MATTTQVSIPTGTWNVDPTHSSIEFRVKHLGISTVRGTFDDFAGTLEVGDNVTSAKAYGKVNAASINTNEPKRDEHLRAPDFFDTDNYPEITFESTAINPIDEDTFEVTGDLSMHGVTKPITLAVELTGADTDPWGNERVGLEAIGKIDRSEWDMKFNQALGSGNMVVSDKVVIALDISAVKQG
jgi:polyisoprenoid-binding protein YceI